jgi:hypothetical protein
MMPFEHATRAIRLLLFAARFSGYLIVAAWLAFVQPGMSYYWLIDAEVHAKVDAELHGQRPDGETLPGHQPHPPHEHPVSLGMSVSGSTLANPFDAAFYRTLLSPAQQPAMFGQRVEAGVYGQSITLEPPDHPPRPTK